MMRPLVLQFSTQGHYPGLVTSGGNVTLLGPMIMVGRLVMRPPILQFTIYV
jgi:hypothetical protein